LLPKKIKGPITNVKFKEPIHYLITLKDLPVMNIKLKYILPKIVGELLAKQNCWRTFDKSYYYHIQRIVTHTSSSLLPHIL
jgi:hypothetical protein